MTQREKLLKLKHLDDGHNAGMAFYLEDLGIDDETAEEIIHAMSGCEKCEQSHKEFLDSEATALKVIHKFDSEDGSQITVNTILGEPDMIELTIDGITHKVRASVLVHFIKRAALFYYDLSFNPYWYEAQGTICGTSINKARPTTYGYWKRFKNCQVCSVCEYGQDRVDTSMHFCPNCGAKMDGVNERL